jgi:hypothetical protein
LVTRIEIEQTSRRDRLDRCRVTAGRILKIQMIGVIELRLDKSSRMSVDAEGRGRRVPQDSSNTGYGGLFGGGTSASPAVVDKAAHDLQCRGGLPVYE